MSSDPCLSVALTSVGVATHVIVKVNPGGTGSVLNGIERLPPLTATSDEATLVLAALDAPRGLAASDIAQDLDSNVLRLAIPDSHKQIGETVDVKVARSDIKGNVACSGSSHHKLGVLPKHVCNGE